MSQEPSETYVPAVLKPDFDLLRFNVRENGALPNKLLPPQRARLGAFSIDPLESIDLLRGVPHILARIHLLLLLAAAAAVAVALPVHRKRHSERLNLWLEEK